MTSSRVFDIGHLSAVKKRWPKRFAALLAFLLPLWLLVGFYVAQYIGQSLFVLLREMGVSFPTTNQALINSVFALVVYLLTIVIVIGVPALLRRQYISRENLGVARWLSWLDIGLACLGFLVYAIVSGLLLWAASHVPGLDLDARQDTGFSLLASRQDILLAFTTLVVLAPLAEELLFRGYLFGQLSRYVPWWLAALITSVLFGFVHGQWNVAIDVWALSLVLCSLRKVTGSIWAGVLLHMIKNIIAFFIVFIAPSLFGTIGT